MSVSYGIVQEHGGSIRAESRDGEGATFIIELPVIREDQKALAPRASKPIAKVQIATTRKRILIIDDEPMILEMAEATLSREGHQIETATEGESALKLFRENRYDLILCDWKMPGLTGRDVYEQVRAIDPQAVNRFIFTTGDVINDTVHNFLLKTHVSCLAKPFSVDDLRAAVRKELSGFQV